jgi:hypothetical protein
MEEQGLPAINASFGGSFGLVNAFGVPKVHGHSTRSRSSLSPSHPLSLSLSIPHTAHWPLTTGLFTARPSLPTACCSCCTAWAPRGCPWSRPRPRNPQDTDLLKDTDLPKDLLQDLLEDTRAAQRTAVPMMLR